MKIQFPEMHLVTREMQTGERIHKAFLMEGSVVRDRDRRDFCVLFYITYGVHC